MSGSTLHQNDDPPRSCGCGACAGAVPREPGSLSEIRYLRLAGNPLTGEEFVRRSDVAVVLVPGAGLQLTFS